MKTVRVFFAFLLLFFGCCILPANSQAITGIDFPYARLEIRTPLKESPYPGLGNYYSALSKGIDTVLWNPASLADIEHAQASISLFSESKTSEYNFTYETEDGDMTFDDQENFRVLYYFTDDETVTALATREHTGHSLYSKQIVGMNYKQAHKVNDWLTLGIISQRSFGASIDGSGSFPMIAKTEANFYDSSDFMGTNVSIDNSGYLTYTYTLEGGSTYQYQTTQTLWEGFLNQNSTIPISVVSESRNDISVDPGFTFCGAVKWMDFSFGASLTPISATCNIDNTSRGMVKEGTPDIYVYEPDVDPDEEKEALNWVQDPNLYGSEAGYKRNTIRVPAGETIAEARFKGFYQASALRADVGLNYAFGDLMSLGIVLENIGNAALNFKGSGRVAYVNSRVSDEAPSDFVPGEDFTWNLFKDNFEPVEDTENYFLEEEVKSDLPKKIRFGLALKKPFLIAIDYEQNQTPIKVKFTEDDQEREISVSSLRFLRIGIESQVIKLPMWIRFGVPLMLKPEVAGLDQQEKEDFDKFFQAGIIPIGLDLGADINFWGTYVGSSLGVNASSFLSLFQLDSLNLDLGKLGYYDIYVKRGPWKLTYLASIDPGSTAAAYEDRADPDEEFGMEHLRWLQTFTVSYKF